MQLLRKLDGDLDGGLLGAVGHQCVVLRSTGDVEARPHLEVRGALALHHVVVFLYRVGAHAFIRILDRDRGVEGIDHNVVARLHAGMGSGYFGALFVFGLDIAVLILFCRDICPQCALIAAFRNISGSRGRDMLVVPVIRGSRMIGIHQAVAAAFERHFQIGPGIEQVRAVGCRGVCAVDFLIGMAIGGPAAHVVGGFIRVADPFEFIRHGRLGVHAKRTPGPDADIPELIQEADTDAASVEVCVQIVQAREVEEVFFPVAVHIFGAAVVVVGVVAGDGPDIVRIRLHRFRTRNFRPVGSVGFCRIEDREVAGAGLLRRPGGVGFRTVDVEIVAVDIIVDGKLLVDDRVAAEGRKGIRVELLKQVHRRHVVAFHQVVGLGVVVLRRDVVFGEFFLVVGTEFLARPGDTALDVNIGRGSEGGAARTGVAGDLGV